MRENINVAWIAPFIASSSIISSKTLCLVTAFLDDLNSSELGLIMYAIKSTGWISYTPDERGGIDNMARRMIYLLALIFSSFSFAKDCIGVVPAGSVHDFWKSVKAGSEKAGQELGLKIYFRGPHDESDVSAQRFIIDQVMENACIGLVLAPNTQDRAYDVARLKEAGVPTVYFDRDTGSPDVVSVIATNNYQAGVIAGQEMAKKLGNKGKVALLRMKKGVISTDAREKGFTDGATASGLSITIDNYLGTKIGEARKNAEQILAQKTGKLDGIFTPNESTTLAVLMALDTTPSTQELVHIGFDSNDSLVNALENGSIYGLIIQQPFEMGYKSVYTVYQAFLGQEYSKNIATETIFVTKENMLLPSVNQALLMKYD